MRKAILFLLCSFCAVFLVSCGTINIRTHYYSLKQDTLETEAVKLRYSDTIDVYEVNGTKVNWDMTIGDKEIFLPEGEYTFKVRYGSESYSDGSRMWSYSQVVDIGPYSLKKGQAYTLYAHIVSNQVRFILN